MVTHTVGNGLRVSVASDRGAPVVAVNLWYNVGSRHEEPGRTGLAHLFEHLMFQGSANVRSGEHHELLQATGGQLNGSTSFERTNYYETVPTGAAELALWLEADRMGGLLAALNQQNLDNQRDVVKNERRQRYDNQPYGTVWLQLYALAFPAGHPYHHAPIGSMADLDAATLDDCAAFFRRHYSPANAVLTVVGDVAPGEAIELVERHFAALPAVAAPAQPVTEPLGPLAAPVRLELDEAVPSPALYSMWRVPPDGTVAADATELALRVLAHGKASRLSRRLVQGDQLAHRVGHGLSRFARADACAQLRVLAHPDTDLAACESTLDEELDRFAEEGPTDEELRRAHAITERDWLDDTADFTGRANTLSAYACLHGDPGRAFAALDQLRAVTADEVRAAAQLLRPRHAARVVYVGQKGASA